MKRIKNLIQNLKSIRDLSKHNPAILKVVLDILKFVEKTHESQKPMVCEIAMFNMKTGERYADFVSLWAGIGNSNPIDRAKQLKAQNIELTRLLILAKEGNLSDEDKQLIETTLRVFDL